MKFIQLRWKKSAEFPCLYQFEDLTYSMYLHFNEERKEILEDIKKSGKYIMDDILLNKANTIERCIQRRLTILEIFDTIASTFSIFFIIFIRMFPS